MAVQELSYTKISELIETNVINNDSVFVVNVNGVTKKIKYSTLFNAIKSAIDTDISALTNRVSTLESSVSSMASTVSDLSGTVNNIITAGFNLIGLDLPVESGQNNNG